MFLPQFVSHFEILYLFFFLPCYFRRAVIKHQHELASDRALLCTKMITLTVVWLCFVVFCRPVIRIAHLKYCMPDRLILVSNKQFVLHYN